MENGGRPCRKSEEELNGKKEDRTRRTDEDCPRKRGQKKLEQETKRKGR